MPAVASLVEPDPTPRLLYETHAHTPLCRHAVGEPEEYAAVALARGLKGLTITCHNPAPPDFAPECRMLPGQFHDYQQMVARARGAWAGRVDILLGLECDYVPGMEAWAEKQLASAPLHYVLASVHCNFQEYLFDYFDGNVAQFQKTYFEHLAMAAETHLFDALAHPDLVKNFMPEQWDLSRILDQVRRCLDRIAAAGTAMELNTSGVLKSVPEMNPGLNILREMQMRNIPVVIGSDAHTPERVADGFETALDLLASAGYRQTHFFINRQRQAVEIDAASASLRGR